MRDRSVKKKLNIDNIDGKTFTQPKQEESI